MMKKLLCILCSIGFLTSANPVRSQQVQTGLEVLRSEAFGFLRGKKVGLITNPTGVDSRLESSIDIFYQAQKDGLLTLAGLYAPEHGVRGNIVAGAKVTDTTDPRTGVKVHSLYGSTRKPTAAMLQGIDILVFDIQDIGSRSYTYISTMGLAMEAAAENGIPFVVLDRPNPLGGIRVEGRDQIDAGFVSFVSQYPVPYNHGMTVGELARLFNNEGLLKNGIRCELSIIPMKGWKREMSWTETGLPWVPTSPHIPTAQSAVYYPATGITGELGTVNIGVGYTLPFQLIGAVWITDADKLAERLNGQGLKGVRFRPIHYKPFYGSGKDKDLHGVQIFVTDFSGEDLTPLSLISFYVLQELAVMYPDQKTISAATDSRTGMFDKVLGTDKVRKQFVEAGYKVTPQIRQMWKPSEKFLEQRAKYLIY